MSSAALRLHERRRPFEVALHAGRLLEIRINGQIRTRTDVEQCNDAIWEKINEIKRDIVIIADYRQAMVFAPERAEDWAGIIRAMSHRIERSAILLDQQKATFNLQLQRGVIRADNRNRKLFFGAEEATAWIHPVLDDLERARVVRFLTSGGA